MDVPVLVQEYTEMLKKGAGSALCEAQFIELKEMLEQRTDPTVADFRKMSDTLQRLKDSVRSQKLADIEAQFCASLLPFL